MDFILFSFNRSEWLGDNRNELFAGLVSSVAILPEVIGFSIIAGVPPMAALFASAVTLLVITFTGGRPAMVSASAGSMALVMASLIKSHGMQYMIAATILTGIIQLVFGYLGVHRLMRFIPKTVMYGFVNALAIMIFTAQLNQLPGQKIGAYVMVLASILLIYIIPRYIKRIPPALIVIVGMTIISFAYKGSFQVVGDLGALTTIHPRVIFPNVPMNIQTLRIIFPTALALAMVGLVESLLTVPIVDQMTNSQSDSKREAKAQGLANILVGFSGGQAGCAMIGQAVINVQSGGRKRLSTFVSGMTLLLFIFVLKDLMFIIPTAALVGIMITVSITTFEWESFQLFKGNDKIEVSILLATMAVILVTHNLAIGIILGAGINQFYLFFSKKTDERKEQTIEKEI